MEHSTQYFAGPDYSPQERVAVIGAGLSGLVCARMLADSGCDVTVFEKSRGVGGRMATRRSESELQFDHGAQFFTVRDERFRRFIDGCIVDGLVAPWTGRIVTLGRGWLEASPRNSCRFVAIPGMPAICRQLGSALDIRFETAAAPPRFDGTVWHLEDSAGTPLGAFDWLVASAPAPQTADLLEAAPRLAERARRVSMSGCWAVMLAFDGPLDAGFDAAFVRHSPLSWVARNASKPGRDADRETWVLHASPEWSDAMMDADRLQVLSELMAEFWKVTGLRQEVATHVAVHRWRYALPTEPLEDRFLFDPELRVGACGDWCNGPRVEGAFLSGLSLAGRILQTRSPVTVDRG
ncbi:FAD-dependent oxidoreductase [Maioricimonas sp. JC845]|uniref:NAD(P)/FAD-dependent oxidoreductase n=1 Tax=Maioricimonas sp. JC845 TaxID=3232138 RepID=UPI0034576C1E